MSSKDTEEVYSSYIRKAVKVALQLALGGAHIPTIVAALVKAFLGKTLNEQVLLQNTAKVVDGNLKGLYKQNKQNEINLHNAKTADVGQQPIVKGPRNSRST